MSTLFPRARLHFLIHATHLKDVVPFYTARSQWRRVLDQIWSQQSFGKFTDQWWQTHLWPEKVYEPLKITTCLTRTIQVDVCKVQNPHDIPFYWLVNRNPYTGNLWSWKSNLCSINPLYNLYQNKANNQGFGCCWCEMSFIRCRGASNRCSCGMRSNQAWTLRLASWHIWTGLCNRYPRWWLNQPNWKILNKNENLPQFSGWK